MSQAQVIILHGLGQSSDDWETVSSHVEKETILLDLFDSEIDELTLASLFTSVSLKLNQIEHPFYLCGLSLGGLLTLMYSTKVENPNLKGIIISGAIYKSLPKWLNLIQNTMFRLLPNAQFLKMGLSRKQLIHLMNSIDIDLEAELSSLKLPTLVICGEKDKINLKSSKKLNEFIVSSDFEIIKNGGHELNKDCPIELAEQINSFITQLETSTKY